MDDKTRLGILEKALAQMLKPVKGIPLNVIITALTERRVIKFDPSDAQDVDLLRCMEKAILLCGKELAQTPICRPRPNEVGNDIEPYVIRALQQVGLSPSRPLTAKGRGQSTGYPDILVHDSAGRPTYIECKIFAHGRAATTMRSFYLSPSESHKVVWDARHLLLAFGMQASPTGAGDSLYIPRSFKLVDLHDLLCDVKYEFNSDNRRLYGEGLTLLDGEM